MRKTLTYNDRAMLVQAVGHWLVVAGYYTAGHPLLVDHMERIWVYTNEEEMRQMIRELASEFYKNHCHLHY